MFKNTKACVFVLVISITFCLIQIFIYQYNIETEVEEEIMKQANITVNKMEIKEETEQAQISKEKNEIWQIEIPKISLIATIAEGTTKDILNHYVGHFEKTQKFLLF